MCGIFGFVNNNPINLPKRSLKKELDRLFVLAQSRGKEAAGLALNNKQNIAIYKAPLPAKQLIKLKSYQNFIDEQLKKTINSALGQARLATHGFQAKNDNNQPTISQNFVAVHNGIITNHQELWSKNHKKNCPESDTQVLLDYLQKTFNKNNDFIFSLQNLYQNIEGSASLIIANNFNQEICISTNTGSLYWMNMPDLGAYFFASESWMLKNFIKKVYPNHNSKKIKIKQLKPQKAIIFTENKKKKRIINLNKKVKNPKQQIKNKVEISRKIIDSSPNDIPMDHRLNNLYSINNDFKKIKKHHFPTEKIKKIHRCSRCILPSTTPFISFDKNGVCNYCHDHKKISYKGIKELRKIVAPFRKKNGQADCLIAFSGGRDSSYGLHFLKKELGMNPIAYTYDWGMVTDIARRNQARIVSKLGVEHIIISADITQKRQHIQEHIKAWLKKPELGMVPLFMEGDKQCEFYADQLMKKYDLELMFFCRGNEFEKEEFKAGHCGIRDADPDGVIHHLSLKNKIRIAAYYLSQYIKNPAYINISLLDTMLAFFATYIQKHQYLFLWHYVPWNEQQIIKTLKNEYNWESSDETLSTWRTDDGSSAFYNYIYYTVQGFTENDSFRSRQIREKLIDRSTALELVNEENAPRYKALKWYFDQVGLDGHKVLTQVDRISKFY